MKKNILLIIDPQNDFVNKSGSLYIRNSEIAIKNLENFIIENLKTIDEIIITQDTHLSYHIGHSVFWKEKPKPGTIITYEDVLDGVFNPIVPISEVGESYLDIILDYFLGLKEKGLKHTIWPEHCILGSSGWCFPDSLVKVLNKWSIDNNGKYYKVEEKGIFPCKEMYSALSYADGSGNSEEFHDYLVNEFKDSEKIFISGFAKDYCVAKTVEDILKFDKNIIEEKLMFLENCMTEIDGNNKNLEIYDKAIENYGAQSI